MSTQVANTHFIQWRDLVARASIGILSKIREEKPECLTDTDTFLEPIKFIPITLASRELIDKWLQVSRFDRTKP